ncbi:MAG: hypothetical protein FWC39_05150 [Bacteroidetes bacterium]|nr:hypothetical protein [Bacteroidota bacterium]
MKPKFKNKDKLMRYFFSFALLLIGVVVGIAIRHYYNLPLSETINIVDVAMLLTTVFLAVYVPSVLDKQAQTMRDKGDVIEQRIMEFQGLHRKLNMMVQTGSVNYEECLSINNLLDVSDHRLETITTLITYYNKNILLKPNIGAVKEFCKAHRELLFIQHVAPEGKKFTKEERAKEEELYNKIDRSSSLLLFDVNDI